MIRSFKIKESVECIDRMFKIEDIFHGILKELLEKGLKVFLLEMVRFSFLRKYNL